MVHNISEKELQQPVVIGYKFRDVLLCCICMKSKQKQMHLLDELEFIQMNIVLSKCLNDDYLLCLRMAKTPCKYALTHVKDVNM